MAVDHIVFNYATGVIGFGIPREPSHGAFDSTTPLVPIHTPPLLNVDMISFERSYRRSGLALMNENLSVFEEYDSRECWEFISVGGPMGDRELDTLMPGVFRKVRLRVSSGEIRIVLTRTPEEGEITTKFRVSITTNGDRTAVCREVVAVARGGLDLPSEGHIEREGEGCAICLLEFEIGEMVQSLRCCHKFHTE